MSTQVHPNIAKGMAEFHGAKPAGDIDLVQEVRKILEGLVPEQQIAQFYDQNRHVQMSVGKISHVQLFQLNRYWHLQFCTVPDSLQARLGLLPDANGEGWLHTFKTTCVPFINKHNLPVSI